MAPDERNNPVTESTEHLTRRSSGVQLHLTSLPGGRLGPEARAFVEEQRRGYERLMLRNLELLGPDDPFANMTSATMRCISRWYELGPSRYTEDCS